MWSLAKFVILCVVAAAVGLAAVSVPIGGKTTADHLRELVETHAPKAPPIGKPAAVARPAATRAPNPADRPPAENPSDADRAALDRLIEKRAR